MCASDEKAMKPSLFGAYLEHHSMLESRESISLSPPSNTVIVDYANGLPQAIPSSRLTRFALCFITLGWFACKALM